jgi:post-segregation antitoxin (ccd killing protein)
MMNPACYLVPLSLALGLGVSAAAQDAVKDEPIPSSTKEWQGEGKAAGDHFARSRISFKSRVTSSTVV